MRLEARKLLYDIQQATAKLLDFSKGRTLSDYEADDLLRSAVERQFEIAGEAVRQLDKLDPDLAKRLSEYPRIIAFRNILIHGYAEVDDRLVWDILHSRVGTLHEEVSALLSSD
jgi:uncharacterized protein with HEPN domain